MATPSEYISCVLHCARAGLHRSEVCAKRQRKGWWRGLRVLAALLHEQLQETSRAGAACCASRPHRTARPPAAATAPAATYCTGERTGGRKTLDVQALSCHAHCYHMFTRSATTVFGRVSRRRRQALRRNVFCRRFEKFRIGSKSAHRHDEAGDETLRPPRSRAGRPPPAASLPGSPSARTPRCTYAHSRPV